MAKIVISDLHPVDAKNFLHDLTPVRMDAVLGGSLDSSASLLLSTIFDSVIQLVSSGNLPNTSGNKILEADFSNLAVNFIVI
jgi:hypothetical protein